MVYQCTCTLKKSSRLNLSPNKQFKSDSARLAFLVWVWFSVYGGQMKYRGRVLHTLIWRYASFLEASLIKTSCP
ncbi:hypothetical protein CGI34_06850 [Vibrio parahaemolyticus]|nr:hypothetical protein CGI34_06850 [Vibrio parahaemolyticus]